MKDTAAETVAQRLLEAEGYTVHRARPNKVKRGGRWFTNSNDLFGCIDLVATRVAGPLQLIQVCQTSGVTKRRRKIEAVPWISWLFVSAPETPALARAEAWVHISIWEVRGQSFRVHRYRGGLGQEAWAVEGIFDASAF
jgi:hypothetical protein